MDKRPNIPKRQQAKPSKLLMAFALVFAFSLPYFLVTHFSHNKKNEFSKKLSLPKLAKAPSTQLTRTTDNQTSHPKLVETPPSQLAKQQVKAKPPVKKVKDNEWQTISPRSGDSMATIFRRLGLSAQNLHAVLQKNPYAKVLTTIKPSQKLQFLISKQRLEKLVIPMNDIQTLTIYRQGTLYKTRVDSKKTTSHNQYVTGVVRGSLYTTAQQLNIPSKLIRQMTQILNKEIDFAHAIRAGDKFSIVYDAIYVEDKKVGIGDILAVSYTNRGKTFQAVRHTKANGDFDYYTPQGESLKKAFSRYPIKFSHISSTFALSRYHPILHYKRAHKGIDLAAPIGTPIQATGDGVITIIDRHNGYGNMIKIKHDKKFSTIYGHMLKFQKGLSKGSKVKRGQVIGYVGQTGLATGPHCHYELHVNNQPRNPTTLPLPTAAPVSSREMASFKAKTRTLFSRLKLFEEASRAGRKNIDLG
jgi:murein DD-endopeptidase MepM/ murein hydrolase activator NlpD